MQMANNKTPDNIIQFPKKYRRPTTPEQDKVMEKENTTRTSKDILSGDV